MFSPPAWGWSVVPHFVNHYELVLPTRVGMVRPAGCRVGAYFSSPHPRGDGPGAATAGTGEVLFSPPAWGWSVEMAIQEAASAVLPTRVGMVRRRAERRGIYQRSPHPRGDGPFVAYTADQGLLFSPPAWGWSGGGHWHAGGLFVLPTRVGMVRMGWGPKANNCRSPHPRGDGPLVRGMVSKGWSFSPPAWGWSAVRLMSERRRGVLPTRVGMVRREPAAIPRTDRSPHPRGDGPLSRSITLCPFLFSPPAWGWSAGQLPAIHARFVLPTRVGMVRASTGSLCPMPRSPHPRGDGP